MTHARLTILLTLCLGALLAGCAPVAVKGRVIGGRLSVITSVPTDDARLDEAGVPGARIVATQKIKNNRTISAVADKNGDFRIPLEGDAALASNLSFTVEAEGYLPARVDMPTPTPQQRLLVVLKPLQSSGE